MLEHLNILNDLADRVGRLIGLDLSVEWESSDRPHQIVALFAQGERVFRASWPELCATLTLFERLLRDSMDYAGDDPPFYPERCQKEVS